MSTEYEPYIEHFKAAGYLTILEPTRLIVERERLRYVFVVDRGTPAYAILLITGMFQTDADWAPRSRVCAMVTNEVPAVKARIDGQFVSFAVESYIPNSEAFPDLIKIFFGLLDTARSRYGEISQNAKTAANSKVQSSIAAAAATVAAASTASKLIDGFSAWFLAGFGAGFVVIVSNVKNLEGFVDKHQLASATELFLYAAICCAIQRYVSVVIAAGAVGAKKGEKIAEKFPDLNIADFKKSYLASFPWILRRPVERAFAAIDRGDYGYSARLLMRLTIYQGVFITAEMALLLVGLGKVVTNLGQ